MFNLSEQTKHNLEKLAHSMFVCMVGAFVWILCLQVHRCAVQTVEKNKIEPNVIEYIKDNCEQDSPNTVRQKVDGTRIFLCGQNKDHTTIKMIQEKMSESE